MLWSHVFRSVRRQPSTTLVALLVLALGIGATTAVFSVLYSVAFEPLPWSEPERIVRVGDAQPNVSASARHTAFLLDNVAPLRDDLPAFDSAAGYMGTEMSLLGGDQPEVARGTRASVDLFRVLQAQPAAGRVFDRSDEADRRENIVVLSHGLATRLFPSPEEAVGELVQLEGEGREVIGVMPPGFEFPDRESTYWVPFYPRIQDDPGRRAEIMLPVIARLAEDVTIQEAQIQGQGFLDSQGEERVEGRAFFMQNLRADRVAPLRESLQLLIGAVVLVLLMACSNVANLLLARGAHREREMATRLSLGARRGDLVGLMFAESAALAATGCLLGVGLAWIFVGLLQGLGPRSLLDFQTIGLNLPVVAFAVGIAALSTLLFGILPALQASGTRPGRALGRGDGNALGAVWRGRSGLAWLRGLLTTAQVAMAIVLLAGAGLLGNSFLHLVKVDPGYEAEGLLTFRVAPPPARYSGDTRNQFLDDIRRELETIPGVESAGMVNFLPLFRGRIQMSVMLEGQEMPADPNDLPTAEGRLASPGYFETMRIPLRAGRTFDDTDRADAEPVVIVNESFVERLIPEGDAIGRTVQGMGRIVGVVGDVKLQGLDSEPGPTFYQPAVQVDPRFALHFDRMAFAARTADPEGLLPVVKERLAAMEAEMPVEDAQPMADRLAQSVATPRFFAAVLGLFAGLALVLAVTGVYGVLAFNASRRAKETGIRLALGEQRGSVMTRTVREGVLLTGVGVILGVGLATMLSRALASLLFGVEPGDPGTLVVVSMTLLGTAALASLLPALRAASVDPVVVLREE